MTNIYFYKKASQNGKTRPLTLSWERSLHIGTSPLIYKANQWTGFYIIKASIMNELILN